MEMTAERAVSDAIRASFNYVVDNGVPAVRYIDWPEMEHNAVPPVYELREMIVRNGRPLAATFGLDTHGFVFVRHDTRVRDFTDESERTRVYDPEVQALDKEWSPKLSAASGDPVNPYVSRRRNGNLGHFRNEAAERVVHRDAPGATRRQRCRRYRPIRCGRRPALLPGQVGENERPMLVDD